MTLNFPLHMCRVINRITLLSTALTYLAMPIVKCLTKDSISDVRIYAQNILWSMSELPSAHAITRSDITVRQTRASADLVVPFPCTETLKRSLTFQGPLLWNGLPLSIRNNNDLQSFKRSAKGHIGNSDA